MATLRAVGERLLQVSEDDCVSGVLLTILHTWFCFILAFYSRFAS